MFTIDENTMRITLTRGDTLKTKVGMTYKTGDVYTPSEGDSLRFALKKNYKDEEPLILKTIPIDTCILHLEPNDTKDMKFGSYVYDIEITFANGDVDTFIDKKEFVLTEEVH